MSQPKTIEPSMLNFFVQNPEAPFWESTETEELDHQDYLIEHEFTRMSNKELKIKTIFLVLGDQYLYKISPKQKLKRIPLITTHLSVIEKVPEDNFLQLNTESPLYGFQITSNLRNMRIYTTDKVAFEQWKVILQRRCLLSNFHEAYHVEKIIGKGSFAKVYLAQCNTSKQQYAVKAFSKAFMLEQFKGKESILNEMRIMRNIKHQNVVQLHEVHETQNSVYFVLELVHGGELLQRVKEKGLLRANELSRIAYNLLSALDHLHQKKIFHRDLKPENLLLKTKENNYDIMIADFGLAGYQNQDLIFKRCGTPGFVAPEILLYADGNPIYDLKCDVFSAGVILYILTTGKQPFSGQDQKAILKANKSCQIDFGLPLFLKAPLELQDLIQKMLQVKPGDRPSAGECLKHKAFTQIAKEVKLDQQEFEENQSQIKNNLANYDFEYVIGLKNQSLGSQDQVGSLQLQWRKPAYNGNVNTVDTLTNCSNASFKQIELVQQKQPQISKFSIYSAKLSRQNSFDGSMFSQDCPSPGRGKVGKEKDLHKIAIKNSFHIKQKNSIMEDPQINQERSEVSDMIKRFNSSDLIKIRHQSEIVHQKSDQQQDESPIMKKSHYGNN